MKTIVALVDFSDITTKVLEYAGDQAVAFDARVILLHIVPQEPVVVGFGLASPVVMEPASEQGTKADYATLETLRDTLKQRGVDVLIEQLSEGCVDKLLEECRIWKADLIVVGSHHHSAVYKWFVGTFTSDVLAGACCPVLVVPGGG
jgi:nucleotide-binding universal stress UspA family protein